jgi:hypothetical protein
MNIKKEILSENISIYRTNYDWEYSKDSLIERANQNIISIGYTDGNTSLFVVKSKEVDSVIKYGLEACKNLSGLVEGENWNGAWVGKTWIFKSTPNTPPPDDYANGYHTHPIAVSFPTWDTVKNKYKEFSAPIKTSWTYCFYLQIPKTLKGNEGMLGFKDGNNIIEILPKEGEFVIFGKDVMHRPNLIPNSNEDRIAICSNVSFNIKTKKSIL